MCMVFYDLNVSSTEKMISLIVSVWSIGVNFIIFFSLSEAFPYVRLTSESPL